MSRRGSARRRPRCKELATACTGVRGLLAHNNVDDVRNLLLKPLLAQVRPVRAGVIRHAEERLTAEYCNTMHNNYTIIVVYSTTVVL